MPMSSGICSASKKPIFFGFYVRGVTLADGMNGRRCLAQRIKKQRLPAAIALPLFTPAANYVILGTKEGFL